MENGATYKGAERALILHQAGWEKRGIEAADPALQPHLEEITRKASTAGPAIFFQDWWEEDGIGFMLTFEDLIPGLPTTTLEGIVPEVYARTPGAFRTLAPIAFDRHRKLDGTGWARMLQREWQAYLYHRTK